MQRLFIPNKKHARINGLCYGYPNYSSRTMRRLVTRNFGIVRLNNIVFQVRYFSLDNDIINNINNRKIHNDSKTQIHCEKIQDKLKEMPISTSVIVTDNKNIDKNVIESYIDSCDKNKIVICINPNGRISHLVIKDKHIINNNDIVEILDAGKPYFRNGDFTNGIICIIEKLKRNIIISKTNENFTNTTNTTISFQEAKDFIDGSILILNKSNKISLNEITKIETKILLMDADVKILIANNISHHEKEIHDYIHDKKQNILVIFVDIENKKTIISNNIKSVSGYENEIVDAGNKYFSTDFYRALIEMLNIIEVKTLKKNFSPKKTIYTSYTPNSYVPNSIEGKIYILFGFLCILIIIIYLYDREHQTSEQNKNITINDNYNTPIINTRTSTHTYTHTPAQTSSTQSSTPISHTIINNNTYVRPPSHQNHTTVIIDKQPKDSTFWSNTNVQHQTPKATTTISSSWFYDSEKSDTSTPTPTQKSTPKPTPTTVSSSWSDSYSEKSAETLTKKHVNLYGGSSGSWGSGNSSGSWGSGNSSGSWGSGHSSGSCGSGHSSGSWGSGHSSGSWGSGSGSSSW
jgi:hypothetical protein